jgi:hypothetical protein
MLVGKRLKGTMKAAAISYGVKAARPVWRFWHLPKIATRLKLAVGYWLAAERDEKNGFPFTAAMEWHKAAELFSPIPKVSDRCWQQWERIAHLPRRFACPVVESVEAKLHYSPTYDSNKIRKAFVNEAPVAFAA